MTNRIVKIFIKNSSDSKDPAVREKYGTFAAIVGIICNLLLFSMKLTIGIMIKSVSVMADAFNNLSDSGSNIVMLIGFRLSSKPADKEHPYGHGRIEYISSLSIAAIIILMALELLQASYDKIIHPSAVEVNTVTLVILLISIIIKIWLSVFYKNIGKKIESQTMSAAAFDCISDVISTSVIIISLLVNKFFGINIDGIAGLLVAVFILLGGIKLSKEAIDLIIGPAIDTELSEKIKTTVKNHKEIKGTHDLVVHSYGSGIIMATIDVEMSQQLTLTEAHAIIDNIEKKAKDELGIRLLLHIDPIIVGNPEIDKYNEIIDCILSEIDPNIEKHSFELFHENGKEIADFEIDIPHDYYGNKEKDLIDNIKKHISEKLPNVICKINIDKSFTKS